ncbi:MAG: YkgJ family cysteine cluster protein [Deltaproteobacteria bacterium]|nr:YkgJ family cysteine cluster protein [Deltaproteobacteria bacterium]
MAYNESAKAATASPAFICRQCGECCRGEKGILVSSREAREIAAFLGISEAELRSRYLVESSLGPQVATVNGACVFLVNNRCRIHPVKPRICREWPFLPALLQHADEFEAAKAACPGLAAAGSHEDFVAQAAAAHRKRPGPAH